MKSTKEVTKIWSREKCSHACAMNRCYVPIRLPNGPAKPVIVTSKVCNPLCRDYWSRI